MEQVCFIVDFRNLIDYVLFPSSVMLTLCYRVGTIDVRELKAAMRALGFTVKKVRDIRLSCSICVGLTVYV